MMPIKDKFEIDDKIIEKILHDYHDKLTFPKTVQHYKAKANIIFQVIIGVVATGFFIFIMAGVIAEPQNRDIEKELLNIQFKQDSLRHKGIDSTLNRIEIQQKEILDSLRKKRN